MVLRGNAQKAHRVLKWKSKITFDKLVRMIIDAEIENIYSSPQVRRKETALA